MRILIHATLVSLILGLTHSAQGDGGGIVAVVDISGSMRGEPLEKAQAELVTLVGQFPVSRETPFSLIPFDGVAYPLQRYHSREEAISGIHALAIRGGTNIASALNSAADVFEEMAGKPAILILVSDGIDGNTEGIAKAEQRLSAVLRLRSERGDPTQMIIKRWGNIERSAIVERLQQVSSAVVDGGAAPIVELIISVDIDVVRVELSPDNKQLGLEAMVTARGGAFLGLKELTIRCPAAQRGAALESQLIPGRASKLAFSYPLPASIGPKRTTDVQFEILGIRQLGEKPIVLQTLSNRVEIPEWNSLGMLQARCDTVQGVKWLSPTTGEFEAVAEIELGIVAAHELAKGLPLKGEIRNQGADNLELTKFDLNVGETKRHQVRFIHIAGQPLPTLVVSLLNASMALKVYPWTVYVPLAEPELPPPVRTPVTIEVASVDPAFWSNLQDKLIQTSIELEINVDGPASQGNRLLYIAPATVHASNLEPDTFGMGTQRVRLNVEAKAIDGESEIVLAYHFAEAAEKNDAIKLDVPHDPVEIHIPSPGRLQLIPILGNGNVLKSWSCTTEANFSDIEFTTVLSGQLSEAAAKNAGEILIKANGQEFSGQLYEPTAVRIPLVWRGQLFRAEKQNLRVELRPTGGLSAIVDSANFQIAVEHPALFTLWLWKYGVWVVVFLATALSVSFVTSIARRKPKFSFVNPVS